MLKSNRYIFLSFIVLVLAVSFSLFIDFYALPKRFIRLDQAQHFYDMKKWYEAKKFPVTSARFLASQVINEEFTTPRVPGGAFYIFYTFFYRLSGENLFLARTFNFIFNTIILYIFLFWLFRKFGIFITSVMSVLILLNGYVVISSTDFWNPNVTLIFSFIFLMLLYDYIENKNETITKLSAIFIFPILAIMAQGHFYTFFSMIPTVILYLIIKYKKTLKYIFFWILGVFISFLEYLPYLISEFKNGFLNTNLIFSLREQLTKLTFPQMHALAVFPTNEMSVFYGGSIYGTLNFWFSKPPYIFGFIFLLLSILFSFLCIFRGLYFVFSRNTPPHHSSEKEKTLIEMLKIFFLFILITITVNMLVLARSKAPAFHYLYSAFSLSFIPIILFFTQKELSIKLNSKLLYSVFILFTLNIFAMTGQLIRYFKNYEEPRNPEGMKTVAYAFLNNTNAVNIVGFYADNYYRDIAAVYFPNLVWQQDSSNLNTNIYIVVDRIRTLSRTKKIVDEYMQYLSNNTTHITNNGTLFVYKYIGREPLDPLVMPPKKK